MEGVLIASADPAVRRSLHAIVQPGRTVHERGTIADALALAAAQRLDLVFVDDVFPDGPALELVERLGALGYGQQVVPLVLSLGSVVLEPFRQWGARTFVPKPFSVAQVQAAVEQIEALVRAGGGAPVAAAAHDSAPVAPEVAAAETTAGVVAELREIPQRLHRLLARCLSRDDLLQAFCENLQEQLEADNVILLAPQGEGPEFRVVGGSVVDEVREQFAVSAGDPFLAALTRLGTPVGLGDAGALGVDHLLTARRYGERLGVHTLCPVTSRGVLVAVVGFSRSHRYGDGPELSRVLRVFLPFFSKALETADRFDELWGTRESLRGVLDALPTGVAAVSADGHIRYLNPAAGRLLALDTAGAAGWPVERLGSRLADVVRSALAGDGGPAWQEVPGQRGLIEAAAVPSAGAGAEVVLLLRSAARAESVAAPTGRLAEAPVHWEELAQAIAHNFKNALVPLKTCAELLPERHADGAFRQSFFEVTRESVGRIDRWIEQLMALGEVLPDRQRWGPVSVREPLERACATALALVPDAAGIAVEREYAASDVVLGSAVHLERAFHEVVRNACEAVCGAARRRLVLRIAECGGAVVVSVSDSGAGLPAETAADPGVPFRSHKMSGLGLGLAVARRVVEAHGGRLTAGAGDAGVGAAIRIELPAAPADGVRPDRPASPTTAGGGA